MRQRSILHECVKKLISIFHLEKGMFPFILTVNYHICSILLCLNLIDIEYFSSCLRKKNRISECRQKFFSSLEMEMIKERDFNPNFSKGTNKFVFVNLY